MRVEPTLKQRQQGHVPNSEIGAYLINRRPARRTITSTWKDIGRKRKYDGNGERVS